MSGRWIAAGLDDDRRQRLRRLYSRTDTAAANEKKPAYRWLSFLFRLADSLMKSKRLNRNLNPGGYPASATGAQGKDQPPASGRRKRCPAAATRYAAGKGPGSAGQFLARYLANPESPQHCYCGVCRTSVCGSRYHLPAPVSQHHDRIIFDGLGTQRIKQLIWTKILVNRC